MIRGIRGATTIRVNTEQEIVLQTKRLFEEIIEHNQLNPVDVASVFISVTDDVTAAFPAKALRLINGWTYVPVMCMREMNVPDALEHCIRIMMHVNTTIDQQDLHHVYLENAVVLRPDLKKNEEVK